MQILATLLVAATLSASALATPLANTSDANSTGVPDFLCGPQVGEGTWFEPGLGACGINNTESDFIVAVSWMIFDNFPDYQGGNPNSNPICDRKINAQYQGNGVNVSVTDRCTGCKLRDLDFSPGVFSQLADLSVGRIYNVTWTWIS